MHEPIPRALAFVLIVGIAASVEAASFPPELRFQSVATDRVTVHFHQGLEELARQAASMATEILGGYQARYGARVGRVHLVLADVEDDPNGFATPLPYPLVSVRAVAPDGADDFGNYESWLRLVLTHELAHVVHLDQAGGVMGFGRKVLGRAPFLFPNALTPTWMIEGLATHEETEGTAFGRGRDPDSRMVLRMAALERDFPKEDRAAVSQDRWPGGATPYLFGESFLRHLAVRSGEKTLPELARVQSRQIIPFFLVDPVSKRVTGSSFHAQWRLWSAAVGEEFRAQAQGLESRGLTASRAVTTRGIRQVGARFSPDGAWLAYTSRSLTRFTAIRLVRADGSEDRRLTLRNGGASLSWTPDGRTIVYDETEVYRFFSRRSDLRAVEVANGRVRRLTRGVRARDPDVSPDGKTIVFVRQMGDRAELHTIGLDGKGLRQLTRSVPGTQWGSPRWSPRGDRIAASRWTTGGGLDVVEVDPGSGEVTNRTDDRAKDVEPTWTPDGAHIVFRSDRDGVSNLYALRRADNTLLRLTNVLGGAFMPSVDPLGTEVAFSNYSSRGYDVHVAPLDLASAPPAEPFTDPYPAPRPVPAPASSTARPYRPLPTMLPRFWSPVFLFRDRENQFGAATGGSDPLFRHVYGVDAYVGTVSERVSVQGFYQYDRLWPTLLVTAEDTTDVEVDGLLRTRRVNLRASMPIRRSVRSSQTVSLAWRGERQEFEAADAPALGLGGIEVAWSLSTVKQYPYSISPVDGSRLRIAYLKEDPAFGSDVSLGKITLDARTYRRLFGQTDVLALQMAGGTTMGRPTFDRSYAVGGFPDADLFDLVRTNIAVLRGYSDNAFTGRSFASANLEYRFPLAFPERGWRWLPVFIRHLHGSVFLDAAHAWSGDFRPRDLKTSAGAALGADFVLAYGLRLTGTGGLARGFAERGETKAYFRLGLAF